MVNVTESRDALFVSDANFRFGARMQTIPFDVPGSRFKNSMPDRLSRGFPGTGNT